jgi:hypothetical protein
VKTNYLLLYFIILNRILLVGISPRHFLIRGYNNSREDNQTDAFKIKGQCEIRIKEIIYRKSQQILNAKITGKRKRIL